MCTHLYKVLPSGAAVAVSDNIHMLQQLTLNWLQHTHKPKTDFP